MTVDPHERLLLDLIDRYLAGEIAFDQLSTNYYEAWLAPASQALFHDGERVEPQPTTEADR